MDITKLYEIFLQNPHICHDTRHLVPGCIYWAIRGDRLDGNVFTQQAFDQGAAFAVIDNAEYELNDNCILVHDSLRTLQDLARHHRRKLGLKVIAIAGSNGKTTTKELMYRVLAEKMSTFATPGNFNNHIGLPLSILQLTPTHKVAILELGANHIGENAFLCDIAEPDMGLITNIGKDHLEGFGGIEGVATANLELFDYLEANSGTALVNYDDTRLWQHKGRYKKLSYGSYAEDADIRGSITTKFPFIAVKINDSINNTDYETGSHLFGSVNQYNILAAAAAGSYFEVDPWQIKNAIESYIPENNRSQIIKKGSNTYILDAYNANPSSMLPAIKDFASYPADHKGLILGDMFELGDESEIEHKNVLDLVEYAQFDEVVLAGETFYQFEGQYPARFFKNTADVKAWFVEQSYEDTVFYIKGSRGMALEKILDS